MALKTFVKAASITNLTDARYCAGMGVDLLGFPAVETMSDYLKPAAFQEIRGWVTGPGIVAEAYGIKDATALSTILEHYRPDYIEFGKAELSLFSDLPVPLLLAVDEPASSKDFHVQPAYLISSEPFQSDIPLLVWVRSMDDARRLVDDKRVAGIILRGGAELRPGLKDSEVLNDVLEFLEEL